MAPVASGSADCRKSVNKLPASLISGSYASSGGSSGNLVDRHFLGDATQRTLMRDRFELAGFEQLARSGMFDDRSGRQDRTRVGQTLHARRDIDGAAEIVLAVVENDGEARSLVNADLEQQTVAAA